MDEIASHQKWQATRQAELNAPESWLGLKGLAWLEIGENQVGSAADCHVVLPTGAAVVGVLKLDAGNMFWQSAQESIDVVLPEMASDLGWQLLKTDREGAPSAISVGGLQITVIERDGRFAARVRDHAWADGLQTPPLNYFDYDPNWAINADWQALEHVVEMPVPSASGDLSAVRVGHQAVFEWAGEAIHLLPISVSGAEIFFVFRDRTSGKETYGAGRFLKANATVDGQISLNFNFAYNPPCAFTAFATCRLPPPENWLPFPVSAGEKQWQGHD